MEEPKVVRTTGLTDRDRAAKAALVTQLHADRTWLVHQQPFIAALALQYRLRPVVDARVETAATDGVTIYANPYFFETLSDDERRFVLAHEVWHGALSHMHRRLHRDHRRWNLAADHEVNTLLTEAGFTMPEEGVLYKGLAQDHAEYVYEQLSADNPWGRPENLCPRDGRGGEREGKVEGDRRAGQHLSQRAVIPIEGKLDPDFTPSLSEDLRDVWRKRIVGAAQRERSQADRSRGLQSGHLSKIIDELAEPTVHWTQHLQRFVTTLYSGQRRWTPPNRRQVYRGLYLPSTRSVELNIAVAIDTSGSTNSDLPQFLGELRDILRSFGDYNLRLIQCDSVIQSDERYCANEPFEPSDVEMKGFGGTEFKPVFRLLESGDEPPAALIYFTDGFAEPPERPDYPVLWAVTRDGGREPAGWGEVVWVG